MIKRKVIGSLMLGITLGCLYWSVLAQVKMIPYSGFHLIEISVWLVELVESAITILFVVVFLGYLSGLLLKRWFSIVPSIGAFGFFISTFIPIWLILGFVPFEIALYRYTEIIAGSLSLFCVLKLVQKNKSNSE